MQTDNSQPSLFELPSAFNYDGLPLAPRFDGATYDAERDCVRLTGQMWRVWSLMRDGEWRDLRVISRWAQGETQAVSARLRDFRKQRFGRHTVNRRYVANGLFEYQVIPNPKVVVVVEGEGAPPAVPLGTSALLQGEEAVPTRVSK